jgi:hypothetical protein
MLSREWSKGINMPAWCQKEKVEEKQKQKQNKKQSRAKRGRNKIKELSEAQLRSVQCVISTLYSRQDQMPKRRLTISNVQTLRIQIFSFPSIPSTPSSSIPSHQHRRAGFRQKRSSFCAIPTALVFARSLPRISVRRRARAKLQMTALFGSPARWPQRSSLLKPLHTP